MWHVTYSSVGEKQEGKQVTVWLKWFFRLQVFSLFCSQLSGGLVIQDLKTKTEGLLPSPTFSQSDFVQKPTFDILIF